MSTKDTETGDQDASGDGSRPFTSLYFAYSSNLSPRTMKQRCPDSLYVGLARLDDWKWLINTTGFANVIPSEGDVVYGSLYFISARDESALDVSEGVPWWNEKQTIPVIRFPNGLEGEGQKIEAMAYIDVNNKEEGTIERDYYVWINRAIEDGLQSGVPGSYVDKYLKPPLAAAEHTIKDIEMVRTGLSALSSDASKIFGSGKYHPGASGGI